MNGAGYFDRQEADVAEKEPRGKLSEACATIAASVTTTRQATGDKP